MKYKIIAVVGLCGSGKSYVCELIKKRGYRFVHFGGIVTDEVKRRNLPLEQKYEKQVREELRAKHGMGAMAILSLPVIEDIIKKDESILIDGLYSMTEYKILSDKFGDEMVTIALYTSKKLRYKRLSNRKERGLNPEQAKERDITEIETIEKGGPIALADYTLINDSSFEALELKVDSLFQILEDEDSYFEQFI